MHQKCVNKHNINPTLFHPFLTVRSVLHIFFKLSGFIHSVLLVWSVVWHLFPHFGIFQNCDSKSQKSREHFASHSFLFIYFSPPVHLIECFIQYFPLLYHSTVLNCQHKHNILTGGLIYFIILFHSLKINSVLHTSTACSNLCIDVGLDR